MVNRSFRSSLICICTVCIYHNVRNFGVPNFRTFTITLSFKSSLPRRQILSSYGHCGGHLGFWIRKILSICDLQATLILPTKFRVNWLFGLGVQNRFSIWWPSWTSCLNDFSFFDLQTTLMLPIKFGINWPLENEVQNRFLRLPPWQPSWI